MLLLCMLSINCPCRLSSLPFILAIKFSNSFLFQSGSNWWKWKDQSGRYIFDSYVSECSGYISSNGIVCYLNMGGLLWACPLDVFHFFCPYRLSMLRFGGLYSPWYHEFRNIFIFFLFLISRKSKIENNKITKSSRALCLARLDFFAKNRVWPRNKIVLK